MGNQVMEERKLRGYRVGDRVRVWRKIGEPARVGRVVGVPSKWEAEVALDGDGRTKKVNTSYMDYEVDPRRHRRRGVLLVVGPSLLIVLAAVLGLGVIPAPEVIRIVVGIAGLASIYLVIRGFVQISEARDPLAPLKTYDRTKDYGSNYAG